MPTLMLRSAVGVLPAMVRKSKRQFLDHNHYFVFLDSLFISQYLNFVELVTITNEKCGETYGQDLIRPEMVCATSPVSQVKSTCSVSTFCILCFQLMLLFRVIVVVLW